MRDKKIIFDYALLSGGLIIIPKDMDDGYKNMQKQWQAISLLKIIAA